MASLVTLSATEVALIALLAVPAIVVAAVVVLTAAVLTAVTVVGLGSWALTRASAVIFGKGAEIWR
jgi:hypothetical protein